MVLATVEPENGVYTPKKIVHPERLSSIVGPNYKLDLPQALSIYFDRPTNVQVDNLAKQPTGLYIAHDLPMWLDLMGRAILEYEIDPSTIPNSKSITVRAIQVTPLEDLIEMNLTGGRSIPELNVLNRKYLLSLTSNLTSPKLVVVKSGDKKEVYLDIDNVGIKLNNGGGMRLSFDIPYVLNTPQK